MLSSAEKTLDFSCRGLVAKKGLGYNTPNFLEIPESGKALADGLAISSQSHDGLASPRAATSKEVTTCTPLVS